MTEYAVQWQAFLLANGGNDTATLRGQFVVEMTVKYWNEIFKAGDIRVKQAAVLPAEEL